MASCTAASVTSSDFFLEVDMVSQDVVPLSWCRKPRQAPLPHNGHFDVILENL